MATVIIAAIRTRTDLKESVLHTAQELAHRASIYGVARASYRYMARKCHCCRQTVMNHINTLEAKGILRKRKSRVRGSAFCEINVYTFTIPWRMPPAQTCNSQISGRNLPPRDISHEKFGSLREEIAVLQKGLRFCTPGSDADETTRAKIARLTDLLREPSP
jgi:hypothetical protein